MRKMIVLFLVAMVATVALAIDYAVSTVQYGEQCAQVQHGHTPLPDGSAYPVEASLKSVQSGYLIIDAGILREKTVQEKADYDAAESNAMVQAVADWNDSKTNYTDIIQWENRFMLRLGQANGILMSEGIITNAITPKTIVSDVLATYMIEATNASASSVGIALQECDVWTTKITEDKIGPPPDGEPVSYYVASH